MAAQAVAFLERAGWIDIWQQTAWNTSGVLSERSIPGLFLKTLIGYSDQPTVLQLAVYLATLCAIFALTKVSRPRPPIAAPAPGAAE